MPQQLIYTSAPRGLVAGRSGYCTVARSAAMREALMLRLEQLSYYHHVSLTGGQERPIFAYRIIDIRGSRFHVLSRIQDAGLDYTGRTNFIAHHLVVSPEEIRRLPTPAIILRDWSGWMTSWSKEPQQFTNENWGNLNSLAASTSLPAQTWQRLTGDPANGYALLEVKPGPCVCADEVSERELLSLMAESMELLEVRDARRDFRTTAWQYTQTTSIQEQDNPADFRWRFVRRDNPAFLRLCGTGCPSLLGLRASQVTAEEQAFAHKGWQAPNRVRIESDKTLITEGDSIRLEASADGVPAPMFQWFEGVKGEEVELSGRSGPTLQEQPTGRAKRYSVRASNRAGFKDSPIIEITINQPLRLAARESLLVRPKIAARGNGHIRTEEEIDAQRKKLEARKEQESAAWKRKVLRIMFVSLIAFGTLVVVSAVFAPKLRTKLQFGRFPGTTTTNQLSRTVSSNVVVNGGDKNSFETNSPELKSGLPSAQGAKASVDSLTQATRNILNDSVRDQGSKAVAVTADTHPESLPPLPPPWKCVNVGNSTYSACAGLEGNRFIVKGGGRSITGKVDDFFFVRRAAAESKFSFTVRLLPLERKFPLTHCGIMVRDSDKEDAAFVYVGVYSNNVVFLSRKSGALEVANVKMVPMKSGSQYTKPVWLRLSRNQKLFSGAVLQSDTNWQQMGTVEVLVGSTNYCGFAVCSGKTNLVVTAEFDNVQGPVENEGVSPGM